MFARIAMPLLGALLLIVLTSAPALAAGQYEGEVLSAENGQLVLSVETEQLEFVVNEFTQITLDGKPAKLEDVRPSHRAMVTAAKDGDKSIAKSIRAQSA